MAVDFTKTNMSRQPVLIFQNPDDTPIGALRPAFNVVTELYYNGVSALTFDLPGVINGVRTPNYDKVTSMRTIDLKYYGRFISIDPSVRGNGVELVKSCTAYLLEYEFTFKKLPLAEGTYNLWSPIAPKGMILGLITRLTSPWKAGPVDSTLTDKYRTFDDSSDQNIYNLMESDLQESYGCIFYFDTYKRPIHVRDVMNDAPVPSVYFSTENLVGDAKTFEGTESIVTNLGVYGTDGVGIRSVSPMGTSSLANLRYFMTLDNFSQSVINKYNLWEETFESYRQQYYNLTIEEALKTARFVTEQTTMAILQRELTGLENIQTVTIQAITQGLKSQSDLNSINARISAKRSEIIQKQSEIDTISTEVSSLNEQMVAINSKIALSAFFTEGEYKIINRHPEEDSASGDLLVIPEVATYDTSGESVKVSSVIFNISRSEVIKVENGLGKDIHSVSGSVLGCLVNGFVLQVNLTHASLDFDSDNNILLTTYVNDGTLDDVKPPSACVSISGTVINASSSVKAEFKVNGATSAGNILQFKINTADLYFTRSMTEYKQRIVEWDLFEYGKESPKKSAYPCYSFSLDIANSLALSEFPYFKNKLGLDGKIYWKRRDDCASKPYLLNVKIPFEDLSNSEIRLSSKCNAFDDSFNCEELMQSGAIAGKTLDGSKWIYNQLMNSGAETSLSKFMKSALDIAKNNIMLSNGQGTSWSKSGLRLRKRTDESPVKYEPCQIWMNNGSIMFIIGNWQIANLTIDQMASEDSTLISGVITDGLISKLTIGNSMIIESRKKNGKTSAFRVNGNGAFLHNAILDIYNANQIQITLNPYSGIVTGKYPLYDGDEYAIDEKNAPFWVDTDGNVRIKGMLGGCDGRFSGELPAAGGSFKGVVQAFDSLDKPGSSILTSDKNRFDSNYLNPSNAQVGGTAGNITMTGSINLQENITWGTGSGSVRVLCDRSSYTTLIPPYSSYPSSSSNGRHRSLNVACGYYASYSHGGGNTWTSAMQTQSKDDRDGYDGEDDNDTNVTRGNIVKALYKDSDDYYYDRICSHRSGSRYYLTIDASHILTGNIDVDIIELICGRGGFTKGYGSGSSGRLTHGAMIYSSNGNDCAPYLIVTSSGCRMVGLDEVGAMDSFITVGGIHASEEITLRSDRRLESVIDYDFDRHDEFFMELKPVTFKYNNGHGGRLHSEFITQNVEDVLHNAGLSNMDFAGLVITSIEEINEADGTTNNYYKPRYGEFISLNTYMTQKLYRRITELENELQSLKEDQYMKDEVIDRLAAILNALNDVSVRGKPNLANLSRSVTILEGTRDILLGCETTRKEEQLGDK